MRRFNLVLSVLLYSVFWCAAPLFVRTSFAQTSFTRTERPTPIAIPGEQIYVIYNAGLRSGPTTIGKVTAGNVLTVDDVRPGWYQVRHKAYSAKGWIPQEAAVPADVALNRFTAIIQRGPTAAAYIGRALIWKARGDLESAQRDLDGAIELEPRNVYALHARGVIAMRQKQWSQSIRDFNDVLRLSSDHDLQASAYHNRGIAHMRLNEFEQAIADFDATLQLDSYNSADAFAHRGEARNFLNGNLDMALADLDEALRQNPTHERAWSMRAANYELRGDWDRALADFNQALALNSENTVALDNRGVVWEKKGNADRAIVDFTAAMRIDPTFALPFQHRARAFERQGKFEKAEADLNSFVRLSVNGGRILALVTRAGFFARRDAADKAQADIAQALQIVNHSEAEPLRELAWFLATCPKSSLRQGSQALQLAKEACQLTYFAKPRMLDALAAAYAESGDFDKAVETDAKAMSLAGDARQKESIQVRMEHYAHNEPYRDEDEE